MSNQSAILILAFFWDNPAILTLLEQSGDVSQLLSQSHCPILTLQNPCELQSTSPVHMNAMKIKWNQLSAPVSWQKKIQMKIESVAHTGLNWDFGVHGDFWWKSECFWFE